MFKWLNSQFPKSLGKLRVISLAYIWRGVFGHHINRVVWQMAIYFALYFVDHMKRKESPDF